MPQYTVRNDKGREVTFEWHGASDPTDADLEEVFAAAGEEPQPTHPHARVGAWVKENAPMLGGAAAGLLTGGAGLIPSAIAAAGGGFIGARLRGDNRATAASEGAWQGAAEGAGGLVTKGLRAVARPLYRAAIPKVIQDKFSRANLTQQGLDSRVLLGTKGGSDTATRASADAGQRVQAAADSVPEMTAQDVQAAFRPRYNRALVGRKTDKAREINAHVRQSMDEIGPQPMSGRDQLSRKAELEPESGAAMRAPNANMAATNPQLANIERKSITRNLRLSPEMSRALDQSQAAIGVQRAAKATENSSAINRLAHGGVWNAMRPPAGFSGAAIGVNELANIPFADLLRMAQIAQLQEQE